MAGSTGAVRAVGDRLQTSSPLVSGRNMDDALVPDQAAEDAAGQIDWDVSVTRPACGPTSMPPARGRHRWPQILKGEGSGDEPGRSGAAETGPPAPGGGQIGRYLGRSRGGFTTKIHLAADGGAALALVLTPDTRRRTPARASTGAGLRARPVSEGPGLARPCPGGQGLHVPEEPPLPATTRNSAHHPRTPRPAKTPQERGSEAAAPPAMTASATRNATPSNEPSTASRASAPSQPRRL